MPHRFCPRRARALALALLAGVLGGCVHQPPAAQAAGFGPWGAAPPVQASPIEQSFVISALRSGVFEVEAARMAAARAWDPRVRSLAQALMAHHSRANAELMGFARSRHMPYPQVMTGDDQARLGRLARLAGREFDREFLLVAGVQEHNTAIALYERSRQMVADGEMKLWITNVLPVLYQHQQAAKAIAGVTD